MSVPETFSEEETLYKYLVLVERRLKRVARSAAAVPHIACCQNTLEAYLSIVRAVVQNPELYALLQQRAYKGEFLLEEYTGISDRPHLLFFGETLQDEEDYSDWRIRQILDPLVTSEAICPKAGGAPGLPEKIRDALRDSLRIARVAPPESGIAQFWENAMTALTAELLAELNGDASQE